VQKSSLPVCGTEDRDIVQHRDDEFEPRDESARLSREPPCREWPSSAAGYASPAKTKTNKFMSDLV
jgi:hypothetical protein